MITYQDFEKAQNVARWLGQAIAEYMRSDDYKTALDAVEYDAQRNITISQYTKLIYDITGVGVPDYTSSTNRIASNFLHRLITQRCSYSLGNGVSFANKQDVQQEDGTTVTVDTTKDALGPDFDELVYQAAYYALMQGVSYTFWNNGTMHVFPMTEFLALRDETDGRIRAGIRFWSLDWGKKPVTVMLFEEDGYSVYRTKPKQYGLSALEVLEEKRPYIQTVQISEADGMEVVGGTNYSTIPVFALYGSRQKQSALVGMRAKIDAFDMIQSGFANDLQDCAQVYWLINNAAGMDESDIARLRDRMLLQHMVVADETNSTITPYTQEIPYNARMTALQSLREMIYRDYGALDVSAISSQARTATEIQAAYQPMDEEADDFEYQLIVYIKAILELLGIEDTPTFKRNPIINTKEQTETVMLAAQYLDDETILQKLPWVTVDEVPGILARKTGADASRFVLDEMGG